jgi:hypothetical protein
MDMQFDAAGQRLFDNACVALEAGADDVTVMESALDVICMLLRREEDRLLRDKAAAMLSHCRSELDDLGDLPGQDRARTLRGAARQAIRVVIAERPFTARSRPVPHPGRRATDAAAG